MLVGTEYLLCLTSLFGVCFFVPFVCFSRCVWGGKKNFANVVL